MIDVLPGFLRSKEFVVALVVAGLVVAGGAVAMYPGGGFGLRVSSERACDAPTVEGAALQASRSDATERAGATVVRTVEYELPPTAAESGFVTLCVAVGDVDVKPSPDGTTVVRFILESDGPGAADAVGAVAVDAQFRMGARGLSVAAWETASARVGGWWGERDGASVDLEVLLPERASQDLDVRTSVGRVVASDLLLRDVDVIVEVGEVLVEAVDIAGNASLGTQIGDVRFRPTSIQGGLALVVEVGDVIVDLPSRADLGYSVVAATEVGEVVVEIGDTEELRESEDAAGERVEARTRGYADKPSRVVVAANAEVGDIAIRLV